MPHLAVSVICCNAAIWSPRVPERVYAAVIDIPYALVRRHLIAREAIPAGTDAVVELCARALIPAN